jgi:hypothetical protein
MTLAATVAESRYAAGRSGAGDGRAEFDQLRGKATIC